MMDDKQILAIDGGAPVRQTPFSAWPVFGDDEIRSVDEVLFSGKVNYWTGDVGRAFEDDFASFIGSKHGVALANGTVALEFALEALELEEGAEVITTSRSFVASASAIIRSGAIPVFADVDQDSQNLSAETVAPLITSRTRAIIAVHLAGWPVEMNDLLALAQQHGIAVIEDCAQAHGAEYRNQKVGSIGTVGTFSFCQDKILTTGGEGGMLTTSDSAIYHRAWSYKDHGKSLAAIAEDGPSPGFRWLHRQIGTNGRMTEIQAAIGQKQLEKLPGWIAKRQANAKVLHQGLTGISSLRTPCAPSHLRHAYYKFYTFIRPEALLADWDRDRIMSAIIAEGIPCYSGSCPEIYREDAFKSYGDWSQRPIAHRLGNESLMLMVHPTLSDADMQDTVAAISKVMFKAQR